MKRLTPDYAGGSIVNLSASLLQAMGAPCHRVPCREDLLPPALLQAPAGVVLLVVDALGARQLDVLLQRRIPERIADLVHRAPAGAQRLSSVFPSTTSVALTSLFCASTPAEHGVFGMLQYFDELGALGNMLTYRTVEDTSRPVPEDLLAGPPPNLCQRLSAVEVPSFVVSAAEYEGTAFTDVLHRGGHYLGFRTQSEIPWLLEESMRMAEGVRSFHSVYWPGVDLIAHAHGPLSEAYAAEMEFVDLMVGKIADVCARRGYALVLTADHGQAALADEGVVRLGREEWSGLLARPPGGGRRALYLEPTDPERLRRHPLVEGGRVELVEVEDALEWFGGAAGDRCRRRVGGFVALTGGAGQMLYDYGHGTQVYRGAHGGLDPDEMLVPLVVVPGD